MQEYSADVEEAVPRFADVGQAVPRFAELGGAVFRFGACELDERRRELRRDGEVRHLEPQVFDVLAYLVRHRERVVTKIELLDEVWGSRFVGASALTSRIKAARRAVGDSGALQAVIRTVHGRGFRFVAATEEISAAGSVPVGGSPAGAGRSPIGVQGGLLVGRSSALERLAAGLAEAAAGVRRTFLVSGEAGIGKTALTEAFVDWLEPDAALVARGQCLGQPGGDEPYLPVLDALSRLGRSRDGVSVVDVLRRAAPSWLLQLPALVPDGSLAELRDRSMGASSQRMLRELVDALELLAADRLLVLVLEDLHWGDEPTWNLVEGLARRSDPAKLLLIGTHRTSPGAADGFVARAQDLVVRGHAEELALDRLTATEVAAALERWLPGLPAELSALVDELTAGVPLFVRDLASSWVEAGVVEQGETGRWELRRDLEDLARSMPRSVHVLLEQDLARLPSDDVQLLEAGAVVGVGFSASAVAAATERAEEDVEADCSALARRGRLVRADGDGAGEGRSSSAFCFLHQLHRAVLYDRVPAARRARYHAALGRWLERCYGPEADEHASELALHFERGGDSAKAADYLGRTGERALSRGAYPEGLVALEAAVVHAGRLPEGEHRDRVELALQLRRALALAVTRGWDAPELVEAYRRAHLLCRRLSDPPERHVVTVGLATVEEMRGHHAESEALAEAYLDCRPMMLLVETYEVVACSAFHLGKFEKAIDGCRRALSHYEAGDANAEYARHGVDLGASCLGWAAFSSWFLGRADDALAFVHEAEALAAGRPHALATVGVVAAFLHQYRGEPEAAGRQADAAIALADEHGYPFRGLQGHILRGWAAAVSGDEAGLGELRLALEGYRSTGAGIDAPYFLGLEADALIALGRSGEALDRLDEALGAVRFTPGFFYEPELHRLRAAALLAGRTDGPAVDEARAALRRGLAGADAQRSAPLRRRLLLASREVGGHGRDA